VSSSVATGSSKLCWRNYSERCFCFWRRDWLARLSAQRVTRTWLLESIITYWALLGAVACTFDTLCRSQLSEHTCIWRFDDDNILYAFISYPGFFNHKITFHLSGRFLSWCYEW